MDPQADELNRHLSGSNPAVYEMLSLRGKALYWPKSGNLPQSAEAVGKAINATAGIALEESGAPMVLPSMAARVQLNPKDSFTYAPGPGKPTLRRAWAQKLAEKNPELSGKLLSLPMVCAGLTHGLNLAGTLFCDPGDLVYAPDLGWENYRLIFADFFGAAFRTYPVFGHGPGLDIEGFRKALEGAPAGAKQIIVLNFPNNPSGYTPTLQEGREIAGVLRERARSGARLVVVCDDAYFGLLYEPGLQTDSIFASLANLHANLLAIKVDGPTKEDFSWGLRIGFVTFGTPHGENGTYDVLEAKTAGAIRASVSNASHLSQSVVEAGWSAASYPTEQATRVRVLGERYRKVKAILNDHPEYRRNMAALPFNSGYFMCLRPLGADAERVRKRLLAHYSTGVIVVSGLIRVAFSAVPGDKLEDLFRNINQAISEEAGRVR